MISNRKILPSTFVKIFPGLEEVGDLLLDCLNFVTIKGKQTYSAANHQGSVIGLHLLMLALP